MGVALEAMTPAEMEQRIEELEDLVRRLCKHTGMRMERLNDLDAKQRTLIPRSQHRLWE